MVDSGNAEIVMGEPRIQCYRLRHRASRREREFPAAAHRQEHADQHETFLEQVDWRCSRAELLGVISASLFRCGAL